MSGDAADGLSSNHRRALAALFTHLEQLLAGIESTAATAGSTSPFAKIDPDLSPTQRQVVGEYVARLRAQMTEAAAALRLGDPGRRVRSSWSIENDLLFMSIALDDSSPANLRGYGPLSAEARGLVAGIEGELERTIRQCRAYLAQGLGRDLGERLKRLERAPLDLDLLRSIERIVTEHGLIELRGLLASLVEQLESGAYEIAVFGRVSCGKSSLLNAVLGIDALPVGVTPITAVPTRITWGEPAAAELWFAEAPQLEVALDRVREFISETDNPNNGKHVTRVVVHVPSPRLQGGIVLVDTPGVGALATHGARESYAYLPRCDLGVVLVDAAGSASREDLELLRLLYDSAIPGMLVVSKADLLDQQDRARMKNYLEDQVRQLLGLELPVHFVSTKGNERALAERWFTDEIVPLFGRAKSLAEASARRKLAHLREAAAAAIEAMLTGPERSSAASQEIAKLAGEIDRCLADADRRCERLTGDIRDLAAESLAIASRVIAAAPRESPPDAAKTTRDAIAGVGERGAAALRVELMQTRDRVREIISAMHRAAGNSVDPEINLDLLGVPSVEVPAQVHDLVLGRSARLLPSRRLTERWIRSTLERALLRATEDEFYTLGSQLRPWWKKVLARLTEQTNTYADPIRALTRATGGAANGDQTALRRDLELLRSASSTAVSPAETGQPGGAG